MIRPQTARLARKRNQQETYSSGDEIAKRDLIQIRLFDHPLPV